MVKFGGKFINFFFLLGEIFCCSLNLMVYFFFTISYPLFIDVYGQPESCIIAVLSKNDTMWQQKELKYFFVLISSFFLTKI